MGIFDKFPNIAKTLGGGFIDVLRPISLQPWKESDAPYSYTDIRQMQTGTYAWPPGQSPQELEDLKYTNPGDEDRVLMFKAMGYDVGMNLITQKTAQGVPLTDDDLTYMSQVNSFLASLASGDVNTIAMVDMVSFVSSAAEGDFSSPSVILNYAKLAPPAVSSTPEEDDLTKSLMQQQTLVMEQQRIETMTARRNYEREGILSVIQMLPSGNRLQFMSAMFQTPHFSELFFGSLDAGYSDGPYVGGVIGSLGGGGGGGANTKAGFADMSFQDRVGAVLENR